MPVHVVSSDYIPEELRLSKCQNESRGWQIGEIPANSWIKL